MGPRGGRAFRVIDLMIAVGVAGVALGLLLPFVQARREEARRMRCESNLRQIGFGLHMYISASDTLPPAGSRDDDPGGLQRRGVGPRQNAWSMNARLLNFIEGQTWYFDSFNMQLDPTWDHRGGLEPANATARGIRLAVFFCPDDPQALAPMAGGFQSSYPNNVGNNRRLNGWVPDGPAYFPGWDAQLSPTLTLANISDGTSNTAIFSETVLGDGRPLAQAVDGLGTVYVLPGLDPNAHFGSGLKGEYYNAQNCQQNARTREFSWKGERWLAQDPGRGGFYSHTMPSNRRSCSYWGGGVGYDTFETMIAASSYHPGGVHVLFMDGSVRFVKSTVAYPTWHAIGTRDGAEAGVTHAPPWPDPNEWPP